MTEVADIDRPDRPAPKPGILDIAPYVAGKAKAVGHAHPLKLSANENVLGCSPAARAAYLEAAAAMNLYPDPRASALRAALAARYRLEPDRLVFGCGSDELFGLLCNVYVEPGDNIVQGEHGFMAWRIAARAAGGEVKFAAQPNLRLDVDTLLAAVDERTRIVFLANPDNPSGSWLPHSEVVRLHEGLPADVVLVLDYAYAEFCTDPAYEDGLDYARDKANVIVTRTFSKIHGLAGLRVGWGYGAPEIVFAIDRIRPPFNTSVPAQAAAVAALTDQDFVARSIALVETWRPWLTQQIGGLGLEVNPSQGNFVVVRFPTTPGRTALDAEAFLAGRGILVRDLVNYSMGDCLRITIGLEEHNRAVVDALAAFVKR